MKVNFSEYKRLFTFGCSLTNYKYPTWANVLNSEINQEFYNFGRGGSGNLFISCRIAEANRRYNFCKTDLVAVMYSSFTREDRYFDNQWQGAGNIFNQHIYPTSFVEKFADPAGYWIKNCALIELTNQYLKTLPCKTIIMFGFPFFYKEWAFQPVGEHLNDVANDLKKIYKNLINESELSLIEFINSKYETKEFHISKEAGCSYLDRKGNFFIDAHPNTKVHYEYLNYLDIGLTEKSEKYTNNVMSKLLKCKTDNEICNEFVNEFSEDSHGLF